MLAVGSASALDILDPSFARMILPSYTAPHRRPQPLGISRRSGPVHHGPGDPMPCRPGQRGLRPTAARPGASPRAGPRDPRARPRSREAAPGCRPADLLVERMQNRSVTNPLLQPTILKP